MPDTAADMHALDVAVTRVEAAVAHATEVAVHDAAFLYAVDPNLITAALDARHTPLTPRLCPWCHRTGCDHSIKVYGDLP